MNPPLVRHLADLARLGLSRSEEKTYGKQFPQILEFVSQVEKVRAGPLPPYTRTITGVQQVLREDLVVPSTRAEDLLRTAPDSAQRLVKVPAVL